MPNRTDRTHDDDSKWNWSCLEIRRNFFVLETVLCTVHIVCVYIYRNTDDRDHSINGRWYDLWNDAWTDCTIRFVSFRLSVSRCGGTGFVIYKLRWGRIVFRTNDDRESIVVVMMIFCVRTFCQRQQHNKKLLGRCDETVGFFCVSLRFNRRIKVNENCAYCYIFDRTVARTNCSSSLKTISQTTTTTTTLIKWLGTNFFFRLFFDVFNDTQRRRPRPKKLIL